MLKLVSFIPKGQGLVRAGALVESTVYDISAKLGIEGGNAMQKVINGGSENVSKIRQFVDHKSFAVGETFPIADVILKAPIPLPQRNVMCVGKNYKDHIAEVQAADNARKSDASASSDPPALPKYPQFFSKAPDCVIGPNCSIESHAGLTKWLDYEAELAVVIGTGGRDIPREHALSHVFGYTIANDVTSRDLQRQHNQWFKGKSLDTSCPMGPCIVPAADLPFEVVSNLSIKLWLNGEKRQDSNTKNMIFDIPEIIAQLSKGFTLKPGDVILTGTPDGVGYAMKPPQTLKAGDKVRIEIQHIGILENNVI